MSRGNRKPDWEKLGPSLLIASCVILAIRTAKWARVGGRHSQHDLETEVDHAIFLADSVLGTLLSRKAALFPFKDGAWNVASDEEVPQ